MGWMIGIVLLGCGGRRTVEPGPASDGDTDADTDGDTDTDLDPAGTWQVVPGSETTILDDVPSPESCCHCPVRPVALARVGGRVGLAVVDLSEAVSYMGLSEEGVLETGPFDLVADTQDLNESALFDAGGTPVSLFVDRRGGELEAYLEVLAADFSPSSESRVTSGDTPVRWASGAWLGDRLGVGYVENGNAHALQADAAGGPMDGTARDLSSFGTAAELRVAAADARLGVAFTDSREGQLDVFFSLLDEAGAPTTAEGSKVAASEADGENPFVVWTGDGFAVSWQEPGDNESSDVWFARVDAEGNPIDGSARIEVPFDGETGVGTGADGYRHAQALLWTGRSLALVAIRGEGRGGGSDEAHEVVVYGLDREGTADPDGPTVIASAVYAPCCARGDRLGPAAATLLEPGEMALAWKFHHQTGNGGCEGDTSAVRFVRLRRE